SAQDPIASQAARKPGIELSLAKRNSDTATTAAASRMAVWASEIMAGLGFWQESAVPASRRVPVRRLQPLFLSGRSPCLRDARCRAAGALVPDRAPGCVFRGSGG